MDPLQQYMNINAFIVSSSIRTAWTSVVSKKTAASSSAASTADIAVESKNMIRNGFNNGSSVNSRVVYVE